MVLCQEVADASFFKQLAMFGGEAAVGDDLIEFGQVCNVNHGVSAELGVVGNDDYARGAIHHGANGLDHKGAGIAEAAGGDAADSEDGDVGRNAVEHSLADGAELNAEARVEGAAGESDLGLPALPKDLGDGDGVGDDLNGAVEEAAGDFGHGGSAAEDDGLPILNEVRGDPSDAHLFFLATDGEAAEVERFFARCGRHGAAVNAADVAAALELNQVAAERGSGNAEAVAQIVEADEVLAREGILNVFETLDLVHLEESTIG